MHLVNTYNTHSMYTKTECFFQLIPFKREKTVRTKGKGMLNRDYKTLLLL